MAVSLQQMMDFLVRKDLFEKQLRDLVALLGADDDAIGDMIGTGEEYSEEATRALIDEFLTAYLAYGDAETLDPGEYTGGYADATELDDDRGYYRGVLEDREDSYLDATQRQLLSSMLYCLLRLVAESPWYDGTFGELESACVQLLDSFGHEVERDEFWRSEIGALYFGFAPCEPDTVASRNDLVIPFPVLGAHSFIGFNDEWPAWFLEDLTNIYEMLSHTLIAESIPAQEREAFAGNPANFAYLKDDGALHALPEEAVDRAVELGWLDGADRERWKVMHEEELDFQQAYEPSEDFADIDRIREARAKRAVKRIERWTQTFPSKDTWCAEYLKMREAYFELGGLEPIDAEAKVALKVVPRWLVGAIGAVLDDRGVSHYNDDIYKEACGCLSQAIDIARWQQ